VNLSNTVADRIKQLEARYNCEIDDDGYAWTAWLVKEGEAWHESGGACLSQQYKNISDQTWKANKYHASKEQTRRKAGGIWQKALPPRREKGFVLNANKTRDPGIPAKQRKRNRNRGNSHSPEQVLPYLAAKFRQAIAFARSLGV
tara:strand:+ start:113 stop:547 length:435 start_codon:yes stop_codon:yes gene_type:complete